MLDRMGISRCRSYGSSKLMVYLVYVLVDQAVMEKAVPIVEPDVMTDDANQNIKKGGGK